MKLSRPPIMLAVSFSTIMLTLLFSSAFGNHVSPFDRSVPQTEGWGEISETAITNSAANPVSTSSAAAESPVEPSHPYPGPVEEALANTVAAEPAAQIVTNVDTSGAITNTALDLAPPPVHVAEIPAEVAYLPPAEAAEVAVTNPVNQASFDDFVAQVSTGEANLTTGVYVEGVFALPIVLQPENDSVYVSTGRDDVTLFQSAAKQGVTGLLAHNYLAGLLFYNLEIGQEVRIVYGDGSYQRYRIENIEQFQRLDFNTLSGSFVDQVTNENLSSGQIFARFYKGDHRVTFQTCLERDGNASWGLTFTTAIPIP